MSFNPDPVALTNLAFCIAVVILSCWWYWKTTSRTPLFIGLAFGLFGISHTLVLLGLDTSLQQIQITVRVAGYAIVATSLFFIAIEVLNRKKAEEDLLNANESLRAVNEELTRSGEELKNNLEELRTKREELLESEEKYRSMFNTFIDIYFQADMDGTIRAVTPSVERITGWTPEELTGTNIRALCPGDIQQDSLIPELSRKGDVRDYVIRMTGRDGRFFDASLNCHVIAGSGENPPRIEGTVRDITGRKAAEDALALAKKKLGLLNTVTFQDIQNAVFSMNGYFQLQQQLPLDEPLRGYLEKETELVAVIGDSLKFAGQYQSMGQSPPEWQNVHHAFLYGISHLNLSGYSRDIRIGGLEVYADPMLENVFFTLAENVVVYAKTATEISLSFHEVPDGLVLTFADNGAGIPAGMKEKIFERRYEKKRGMGLFLSREILSITGITIRETGEAGSGARFDMHVPGGGYRFAGTG